MTPKKLPNLELPLLETLYPTLECTVLGNGESIHKPKKVRLSALVDPGFDDFFSIPQTLAKELNLETVGETEVVLGDGSQITVDIAEMELSFDFLNSSLVLPVIIDGDDECLIGTRLLQEICQAFEINFEKKIITLKEIKI
jgi:clan AA aspartic protease